MQLLACGWVDACRAGAVVAEPDRVERGGGLVWAVVFRALGDDQGDGRVGFVDLKTGNMAILRVCGRG